jgi:hypothetical protein
MAARVGRRLPPWDARNVDDRGFDTDLPLVVAGDLPWIEPVERATVGVPLAEDGAPAQTRLRSFEDEELEEEAIVVYRDAPFFVVVGDVRRVGS